MTKLLCYLLPLTLALPMIGAEVPREAQAEELRVRIDRQRPEVINRAPEQERAALSDDKKWGLYASLYIDAFKVVPPEIVNDAILSKAAVDAAELILKGRSMMRDEERLKAYVQKSLPELQKRIGEAPLDDATIKAALSKLNETGATVERVLVASVAKARIESKKSQLPIYVLARAELFNMNGLETERYLEWSLREYVEECISAAIMHHIRAESNHMQNFWYGNTTAKGWLNSQVKTEDQLRNFVAILLIDKVKAPEDSSAVQSPSNPVKEPSLVVDETFQHRALTAAHQAISHAIGVR